jgi:hypothetical protein
MPETMSADDMLALQDKTAAAQAALEDQRHEHMLDVEKTRMEQEAAEADRLRQQGVAEEAALRDMESGIADEIEAQEDDEEDDLLGGFSASLIAGLSNQGTRPE